MICSLSRSDQFERRAGGGYVKDDYDLDDDDEYVDDDDDDAYNTDNDDDLFRSDQFERRVGGGYDAEEFEEHPERYISNFAHKYAPYASVIVNGIYWSPAVSI